MGFHQDKREEFTLSLSYNTFFLSNPPDLDDLGGLRDIYLLN